MAKNDKRDLIIDAALEVFCEKGYANSRMADIAKRAGVSYGLVYHYFGSKEILFDTIVETWWENLYEVLEQQKMSTEAFEQKLQRIIEFFLNTYITKPNLITIFVSEVSRSSVYHTANGLARFRKTFDLSEEVMVEGQKNGVLRHDISPRYLTYIFFGTLETIISVIVLGKEKINMDREVRIINAILQVFLNGARA